MPAMRLAATAALFLFVAAVGCNKSKPTEPPADVKPGPQQDPNRTPGKGKGKDGGKQPLIENPASFVAPISAVEAKLTPADLPGRQAVAKHNEQWVEVTGIVQRYGYFMLDPTRNDQYVKLVDKLEDTEGVWCLMPGSEPWAVLAVGQTVTIKGYCTTRFYTSGPAGLLACSVVSAGESPALVCTAEQLIAAATTPGKTPQQDKPVIVTGAVSAVSTNPLRDEYVIKLKGTNGIDVCVSTEVEMLKLFEKLKVGQMVKLAGSYGIYLEGEKRVFVNRCYLITGK